MEMKPLEKGILTLAAGMMGLALLGLITLSCLGGAYFLWEEQQTQLFDPPPPPPLPTPIPSAPTAPTGAPATATSASFVGVWTRTDDDSHSVAIFGPIGSEGYGQFHSSVVGDGAWFAGRDGLVFLITGEGGVLQWTVTFPTSTTMTIRASDGSSQTWRKVAALM